MNYGFSLKYYSFYFCFRLFSLPGIEAMQQNQVVVIFFVSYVCVMETVIEKISALTYPNKEAVV